MATWIRSLRPTRWTRGRRPVAMFAIALTAFLTAYGVSGSHTAAVVAQKGGELDGTGTVSGTVTATKAFKAAQVYNRSQLSFATKREAAAEAAKVLEKRIAAWQAHR